MNHAIIKKRLLEIFDHAPEIRDILLSSETIEGKRKNIRKVLSDMLVATFKDDPLIPPLEWVLTRDAIRVFTTILSYRSERLSQFKFLKYIDDLLHNQNPEGLEMPGDGFLAELEHIIKGIACNTEVYTDKKPEFLNYEGIKAARLRSKDLSEMARSANEFMQRYPCGLDDDIIRNRDANKARIMEFFGATELEWNKWKWHLKNIIRNADVLNDLVRLTKEEYEAVKLARKNKIPFGITPYYLSLMDFEPDRKRDYAIRSQVIPSLHYVNKLTELKADSENAIDFMQEQDTSPIEGITRRYPKILILKPILTCPQICVYCQRNWEIEDVYSPKAAMTQEKLDAAVQWIAEAPEINEVLITGGDPLIMADRKIENLLYKLSKIRHIERIRICTRTLVTLPQRITDTLIRSIHRFHLPGKREIVIITHFEHPYEITPESLAAVQKFRRYGIDVYNQLVYTFYNSRKFEAAFLRHQLKLIGVTSYYTFNTKGKEETNDFRTPIARLLQEQQEEARLLPGTVRTDEIVFNLPRLGKNYLRATQRHDVISILPNGCRVYEFHPWEKKLSLMDTYIYTDVSIHDYLEKLIKNGENVEDYKTIWYYY